MVFDSHAVYVMPRIVRPFVCPSVCPKTLNFSTFGGSDPALTAHGSLDLKQEIQIQIQIEVTMKL
jgi:hypothetical protein